MSNPPITREQWADKLNMIAEQTRETVKQELAGVGVRSAVITCRCGWVRSVVKMYQCLYCKEWMCERCAEVHFGKTVAEYRKENPLPDGVAIYE